MLSRKGSGSEGVMLNTEDANNLPLYGHLGYRRIGHATVTSDLEIRGFFHAD